MELNIHQLTRSFNHGIFFNLIRLLCFQCDNNSRFLNSLLIKSGPVGEIRNNKRNREGGILVNVKENC